MFEGQLVYHFVAKKDYRHFPPKPIEIYYEPVLVINYCIGHYEVISNGVKKILKTVDILTQDELDLQNAKLIPGIPEYYWT